MNEVTTPAPVEVYAAPMSGGAVATRTVDVRDALALGWVQAHENRSVHTADRYRRDIATFFGWADAQGFDVFSMLPWHIEQYHRWLQNAEHVGRYRGTRKLSPQTRSGKLAAVSSFYRYAQRQTTTAFLPNPAEKVERPKVARESKTTALTKDEVDRVLAVAMRRGRREYALVMLFATTGLRVSEVCQLDTGDLVRDGGEWMLRVVRKGSDDVVLVGVPDPAARALRRYMRGRRGALFQSDDGERMTRRQAASWLHSLAVAVFGTPAKGGKVISPHSFRHTATTLSLNAGVHMRDVAAQMGHRSMETTARYDRANRTRNNPAVKALGEMFEDGLPDVD